MRDSSNNTPSTSTSNTLTVVEVKPNSFSQYTPNTFDASREEIQRNSNNIAELNSLVSPEVLSDVKEKLLDEK